MRWSPIDALEALEAAADRTVTISVMDGVATRASGKQIADLVRGTAAALQGSGIASDDIVAIWAPNSPRWVAAGLACHLLGVILAPIDAMLSASEARRQVRDSRARVALISGGSAEAWGKEIPTIVLDQIEPSEKNLPPRDYAPDLPIALFRTSGTTGTPKMFYLSMQNIGCNVRFVTDSGDFSARDRVLLPLPMHHVFPWITATLSCLTLGAMLVLPQSPSGPHVTEALKLTRPTILIGVPRLYEAMLAGIRSRLRSISPAFLAAYEALLWLAFRIKRASGGQFGSYILAPIRRMIAPDLHLLVSGGAHLPIEVEEELETLGWDVRGGYGLAETSGSVTAPIGGKRLASTGRAVAGCEIRIDNPNADGIGEILLKGPVVFAGYLDNPRENERAFTTDGFFRSGDLGRLDADGFLFVTGRAKEVIVLAGGDNLYPEDVEARYLTDPLIAEIGVMERNGALVAVIVPNVAEFATRKLISPREAIAISVATIAKDLPSTWRLSGFVLSHEPLPRTRLLKIRRFMLPRIYEDSLAGRKPTRSITPKGEDAKWIAMEPRASVWQLLLDEFPNRAFGLDGYITYDLGLDSFGWMNLSLAVEDKLGVRLSVEDTAHIATVRDLLKVVTEKYEKGAESREKRADITEATAKWLAPRTRTERLVGYILHGMNVVLMRTFFRLRVDGRAHLAGLVGRPALICPNHASDLDPLAVAAALPARLRSRVRWSGSRGAAFGTRLRRALARSIGMFPVDQAAPMMAVAMAVASLNQGMAQVWFPEGLLTPDGKLLPFHEGIGHVVAQSAAPVVPVIIDGSYAALPRDRRFPRPRRIRVIFGPPIAASTIKEGLPDEPKRARIIAERLRKAVLALASAHGLDLERKETLA